MMGICMLICAPGFGDCDGDINNGCETEVVNNPVHCGACFNACLPAGQQHVINSTCTTSCLYECETGWSDCDTIAGTGCETHLPTDPFHCGVCGNNCLNRECLAGACESDCIQGWVDCDGDGANGCEAHLDTDPNNCGACGVACPGAPADAVGCTCNSGVLELLCAADMFGQWAFGNCDGDASNGCETSLVNNPQHCGQCGLACECSGMSCD
jgi:hypothetical protein